MRKLNSVSYHALPCKMNAEAATRMPIFNTLIVSVLYATHTAYAGAYLIYFIVILIVILWTNAERLFISLACAYATGDIIVQWASTAKQ